VPSAVLERSPVAVGATVVEPSLAANVVEPSLAAAACSIEAMMNGEECEACQ
jgi:hypothetical protein